jgi:hypothetical protein
MIAFDETISLEAIVSVKAEQIMNSLGDKVTSQLPQVCFKKVGVRHYIPSPHDSSAVWRSRYASYCWTKETLGAFDAIPSAGALSCFLRL